MNLKRAGGAVLLLGVVAASPWMYSAFYVDYSDRAIVATALAEQAAVKQQIEIGLRQGVRSAAASGVERTPLYTRVVDAGGNVALYIPKINTTVVLTPVVNGQEVQWSCSGDVMKNLVTQCRRAMNPAALASARHAKEEAGRAE